MADAADWRVRIDSGRADMAAFDHWRQDPYHAAAYARVLNAWYAAQQAGSDGPRVPQPLAERRMVGRRAAMAIALGVGTTGLGGAWWLTRPGMTQVETALGESRALALSDSLRIQLGTDTAIRWSSTPQGALVEVLRGEVAALVNAGTLAFRTADFAGTFLNGSFTLRLADSALALIVVEGAALLGARDRNDRLTAGPGERLVATRDGIERDRLTTDQLIAATSWRTGEIVLLDATLREAVDTYNRNLRRKIIIGDPSIEDVRIGGRFSATEPELFLRALASGLAIRSERTPEGIVLTPEK